MKTNLLRQSCARYRAPQEAQAKGIYPYYKPIESEQSTVVKINGKDVLMFGSNSYLGLSNDPRLKEAAIEAVRKYGPCPIHRLSYAPIQKILHPSDFVQPDLFG